MIDRNDWLDIRQRTEDTISAARREYDRLAGSATVLGDIPPSDAGAGGVGVVEHRPAAARRSRRCCTRSSSSNLPPGTPNNPAGNIKDPAIRREREMTVLRQRVEFDWRV